MIPSGHLSCTSHGRTSPKCFFCSLLFFSSLVVSFTAVSIPAYSVPPPLQGPSGETIVGYGHLMHVEYLAGGQYIGAVSTLGGFLFDSETGELAKACFVGDKDLYRGAFTPDGSRLVVHVGGHDESIVVLDVDTGEEMLTLDEDDVNSLDFSPDGTSFLTLSENPLGIVRIRDTSTGEQIHEFRITRLRRGTETGLAAAQETASVRKHKLACPRIEMSNAVFAPSGKHILISSRTSPFPILLVDIKTGTVVNEYEPDYSTLPSEIEERASERTYGLQVSMSADCSIVMCMIDHGLILWDAESAEQIRYHYGSYPRSMYAAAVSPNNRSFVVAGPDGVTLWDVETGEMLREFEGHTDYVISCSFSQDGRKLMTAGHDGTIRICDLATARSAVEEFGSYR